MRIGRLISGHYIHSWIALQSNVNPKLYKNWCSVGPTLGLEIKNERAVASLTRGLVGDSSFAVLPEITSRMTFIITLIAQLVIPEIFKADNSFRCARCYGDRRTVCFLRVSRLVDLEAFCLVIMSMKKPYSSFWFLSRKYNFFSLLMTRLLTIRRKHYLHALRIITVSGCVGLLPLLFTPQGLITGKGSDVQKTYSKLPILRYSLL
jgi:alpha-1,3-glucosyltransferase